MSDRFARDKNEPLNTEFGFEDETLVNPDEEIVDLSKGISGTYAAGDASIDEGSKLDGAKDKAMHAADDAKHKAADVAGEAKHKAQGMAEDAKHKASDVADTLKAKADDMPSMDEMKVQGKAKMDEAAHMAEEKADEGIDRAAGFMATASDKLEEQGMKRDDQFGDAATMAAEKMDSASQYLSQRTSKDILDDIETLVKEKPLESVLVAAGVGLLLSRIFS